MLLEELDRVVEAVVGRLALIRVRGISTDGKAVTSVVLDELECLVVLEDLGGLLLLLFVELMGVQIGARESFSAEVNLR